MCIANTLYIKSLFHFAVMIILIRLYFQPFYLNLLKQWSSPLKPIIVVIKRCHPLFTWTEQFYEARWPTESANCNQFQSLYNHLYWYEININYVKSIGNTIMLSDIYLKKLLWHFLCSAVSQLIAHSPFVDLSSCPRSLSDKPPHFSLKFNP